MRARQIAVAGLVLVSFVGIRLQGQEPSDEIRTGTMRWPWINSENFFWCSRCVL